MATHNQIHYSTGDHIGQYIDIATSGNTGNVGYHLHFDVNNLNLNYPGDFETIDPMLFYPHISGLGEFSNSEHSEKHNNDKYRGPEHFFDNNVIEYIGKDGYDKWFELTSIDNRTMTNLKKEFNLSDSKINELTVDKVKATELEIYGVSSEE